jgi:hypothetical protein
MAVVQEERAAMAMNVINRIITYREHRQVVVWSGPIKEDLVIPGAVVCFLE